MCLKFSLYTIFWCVESHRKIIQGYRKWASVIFIWAWKFIIPTEHKPNLIIVFFVLHSIFKYTNMTIRHRAMKHGHVKYKFEDIDSEQQTIIGRCFTLLCYSPNLFLLTGSFFIYIYTNNLHINSIHAASLSWNVFFSFLCL